jgi:hypothetical protein
VPLERGHGAPIGFFLRLSRIRETFRLSVRWESEMTRFAKPAALIFAALLLAACGDPTKEDILKRSEGANTKALLEKALGRPADIKKLGPVETWTYRAANGAVVFLIAGDQVTLTTTSDQRPEEAKQ